MVAVAAHPWGRAATMNSGLLGLVPRLSRHLLGGGTLSVLRLWQFHKGFVIRAIPIAQPLNENGDCPSR
jgi:hypothetical protein